MGSWNETCAISNLPICPGDEVCWVLLTKSPYAVDSGGCYYDDFFFVRSLPIVGTYDDYGGIEVAEKEELFIQQELDDTISIRFPKKIYDGLKIYARGEVYEK